MDKLARKGNTFGIKQMKNFGYTYSDTMCYQAVKGGHLETLKYLRRQKCCWDVEKCLEAAKDRPNRELEAWIAERSTW